VYDVSDWPLTGDYNTNNWSTAGIVDFIGDMDQWELDRSNEAAVGTYVGRYGDSIKFSDLHSDLQTESVELLGDYKLSSTIHNSHGGDIVCGSQGEIAPDPYMDDHFDVTNRYFDAAPYEDTVKQSIWTRIALDAPDQLRQRMAWALSQMMVVNSNTISDSKNSETNLAFYDIFVNLGTCSQNGFRQITDVCALISIAQLTMFVLPFVGSSPALSNSSNQTKLKRLTTTEAY
jgi:hypothetical protein